MKTHSFHVMARDPQSRARTGTLRTAHGAIETPAFMPVGTQATVKTLSADDLKSSGARMILANVYHLLLRPGPRVIQAAGGLHRFMGWDGAILTDSGGFQVFSLRQFRKVTDEGVAFQSLLDGSKHHLTPESVMEFQQLLGSDVIVPLDECVRYPCERLEAEQALARTQLWAERSMKQLRVSSSKLQVDQRMVLPNMKHETCHLQLLFGIVQGATYPDLRRRAVEQLQPLGFDGYAIGGVSVGEPRELMLETLEATTAVLPEAAPHYLMGVGEPLDLVEACLAGADLFDCVIPTRHGRNGVAYTWAGKCNLRNAAHAVDQQPIDPACGCYACQHHTRSYLHHLVRAQELLGLRLLSLHNLWFYADLMRAVRTAIPRGELLPLRRRLAVPYSEAIPMAPAVWRPDHHSVSEEASV